MKRLLFMLSIPMLCVFSQPDYPKCIKITSSVVRNIDTLTSDTLLVFLKQFSIGENRNNVEFMEWGNETIFTIMEKKPELFFNTLFKMTEVEIGYIKEEINSPIHDGINIIKIYELIEKSGLNEKEKTQALEIMKSIYESTKTMIENWEKKNNQKWTF